MTLNCDGLGSYMTILPQSKRQALDRRSVPVGYGSVLGQQDQ
jgi:hypothetical protein